MLSITDTLREQDVDIFLKTNNLIAGRDFIELSQFRQIFEAPVAVIRKRKTEEMSEINERYTVASKHLRQEPQFNKTSSFGQSMQP